MLEAVRRREPQALGEFFEAYFDWMYGLAYRLLGRHALAEDVVQEVFLKVHRAAQDLDPTRDPGPWLAMITRNACREHWRRRGGRVATTGRTPDHKARHGENLAAGDAGPERATLQAERESALMKAMLELPAKLREVVVLHEYQGMDHEEIARLLATKGATIRKRYSRALSRLRRSLRGVIE